MLWTIAVVLALLLAILQADVHRLKSLALPGDPNGINPVFLSP